MISSPHPVLPSSKPPAMSASLPDIIDDQQFQYCLTGEHAVDLELLQMGVAQCERTLSSMADALHASDGVAWKMLAHRSYGSSSMMGFKRVAQVLDEAEHGVITKESMAASLAAFTKELTELRGHLESIGYPMTAAAPVQPA